MSRKSLSVENVERAAKRADLIGKDKAFEDKMEMLSRIAQVAADKKRREMPLKYFIPNGAIEKLIAEVGQENGKWVYVLAASNSLGKTAAAIAMLGACIWGPPNKYFEYPRFQKWKFPKKFWYMSELSTLKEFVCGSGIDGDSSEIMKWFPEGRFSMAKNGKDYYSSLTTDNGWLGTFKTYDMDAKMFESDKIGVGIFDEPPPKQLYNAVLSRLTLGGIIIMPMTPLYSSAWVKDDLVDHAGEPGSPVYVLEGDVEQNCFAENTEYLTRDGWKDLSAAQIGDIAATYNINTKKIEYQSVTNTVKYEYHGSLLDVGRGISATPDHRMLTFSDAPTSSGLPRSDRKLAANLTPKVIPAEKLYRGVRMLSFAQNGCDSSRDGSPFPDKVSARDWCELMGWYVAEGCATGCKGGKPKNYGVYICQKFGTEKREQIRQLLARTGWGWRERKNDFFVFDKELHQHLLPLGNSYNRFIPRYMFDYSAENLQVMWQALLDGDGDGDVRYITTSPKLADDVQELLIRLGYTTSVRTWTMGHRMCQIHEKAYKMQDQYCVRANNQRYWHVNERPKPVEYHGDVSCVSVPNEFIIVRNKFEKYPLITGNCKQHGKHGRLDHSQIEALAAQYDEDDKEARLHGRFMHLSGLVFKGLNPEKHRHSIPAHQFRQTDKDENGNPCEKYKIYHVLDPHDSKPPMAAWFAVDKYEQLYVVDEYPKGPIPFHLMKKYKRTTKELVGDFRDIEVANGWDSSKITRIIDPNFGNKPVREVGMTVAEYLHKVSVDIKYPISYITNVSDNLEQGHRAIKDYLELNSDGHAKFFVGDKCPNIWFHLTHYAIKENTGKALESKGMSEMVNQRFKDGCDVVRYLLQLLRKPQADVAEEKLTSADEYMEKKVFGNIMKPIRKNNANNY